MRESERKAESDDVKYIEIRCPKCGKLMFRVVRGTTGTCEFYCRHCHEKYQIKL